MSRTVVVKQDAEKEIPVEVIAASIVAIADGLRKLRSTRLNDRALHLLVQHAAPTVGGKHAYQKVGLAEVKAVFEGIEALERTYLKKKEAK